MKSNRILQFVLVGIFVVILAAAGFLYFANSREVKQQKELTDTITRNQAIIANGFAEKAAKEKEATELANELASAEALLSQVSFRDSAESIEYDRILFSISNDTNLQITGLSATPPLEIKETDIIYQLTTFTIMVEGKAPASIFSTAQDSIQYTSETVENILAFVNKVAASDDFDTAMMQSVNIASSEPMTDDEVADMITSIKDSVAAELTEAETKGKTEAEIAEMVQTKLAAKSSVEIQQLMKDAGWKGNASAVITIKIWTYKGA